jgi:hypothetical protein
MYTNLRTRILNVEHKIIDKKCREVTLSVENILIGRNLGGGGGVINPSIRVKWQRKTH